jgi:hypothetical protein
LGLYILVLAGPVARLKWVQARLLVAGMIGGAILVGLFALFPACRDPSQLYDPLFHTYWMGRAEENFSPWRAFLQNPMAILPQIFACLCLALGLYLVAQRRLSLMGIAPLGAVLLCGLVGNAFFVRVGPMLSLCVIILFAPAIVFLLTSMAPGIKRAGIWVMCMPSVLISAYSAAFVLPTAPKLAGAGQAISATKASESLDITPDMTISDVHCLGPAELKAIQALPPSRILAPFGQSEYLLKVTPHHLVYAGYHRLNHDIAWVMHWLLSEPEVAAATRAERRFDYVSICPRNVQFRYFAHDYPKSLVAKLMRGDAPDWLVPVVRLKAGGMVYRVRQDTPSPQNIKRR